MALLAETRGLLSAGLGLLLAKRINADQRRAVGGSLVAIAVVTTIPLALMVFNCRKCLPD